MKFLNHNLFTGNITVNGTTTLSTATGITRTTSDNSTHLATTAFVKAQGYLTTETDTLDSVTDRGSITTNSIGIGTVNIIGTTAGAELLTIDGTFGRLFTVTDDLSDSLFSVNTVAGLPVIEVFANNTINLGAFSNPIVIDSSSNIVIPGTITASGYNSTNWNTAYNDRIVSAAVTGTTTKTITLTQTDGGTISTSWTDINTDTDGYISNVSLVGSTLSFTSVGSAFSGIVDLSTLTPTVRTVYEIVKNVSGATILKGTPLAVVTGQTSGSVSDVVPADAADPTKMPAVFIANQNIAIEAEGEAVLFGNLTGVNTAAYTSGTTVYVAPGGGWTATKPVWPNKIQNLGVITKQHATNGAGIVTGVGRANDLPNLTAGKIWVGSANYPIESTTVHVDEANGRVGIGTASPDAGLDVRPIAKFWHGSSTNYTQFSNGNEINTFTSAGASSVMYLQYRSGSLNVGSGTLTVQSGNGNVGIGTTSPNAKLDVAGSALDTYIQVRSQDNVVTSVGESARVRFSAADTTFLGHIGYIYRSSSQYGMHVSSRDYIHFEINNDTSAKVTIDNSGNVGIGTTSPGTKLDVSGVITATGGNSTNWNTAFGWGNHASAGYGLSTADITAVGLTASTLTLTRGAGNLTASVPTFNQNTTGSAATLTTSRTIALTGDVTYTSGAFNGSANVTGTATLASVGTAGTYTKVTTDAKGRVTSGTTLVATDIPALDAAKITTGTIDAARLPSYVDDVLEFANLASFPVTGETGKLYVALDTNKVYRWSGSTYIFITSGAVDSVAGKTGVVTLVKADVGLGNVDNTSDADKPVSTATQTALDLKANLASPTFTGTPTAPTAATATNTTQIATTAYVKAQGYITSYTEVDTLATVTGRGATTSTALTLNGNVSVGTSAKLSFGSQVRQMIDLWSTSYGIGVQSSTQYFRTGSGFAWFRGGVHSDTANDAGSGGVVAMRMDGSSNLTVTGNISAANFSGTSSGTNTGDQTTITGNAGSATVLQTARTFTIGSTGKTFNGSANVSWSLAEIGAAATSHTHAATDITSGVLADDRLNTTTARLVNFTNPVTIESDSDGILNLKQLGLGGTAGVKNAGWNYIQFLDSEGDRQGYFGIDSAGNFQFASEITGNVLIGGSRVYTVAYHPEADTWTTARTLTIGNTGKSVNGSANVSWTLAEIGALGATAKAADSELLDGIDSSSFLRSDAADTATGEILFDAGFKSDAIPLNGAQNFDNISRSGFYNLYNTNTGSTNSPGFPFGTMIVVGSNKGGSDFGLQLAHERLNTAGGFRIRGMNDTSSAWSAWATVWTSQDFANNSANWNTAFGWGNHASAGYGLSTGDITAVGLTASTLTLTRAAGNLTAAVPTFNQNTTGSAATLTTARTIALTGDVTYTSGVFNGSANVTGVATLANSGVTAGTYTKVTVDAKGRVTTGASIVAADVPTLNQNTTGSAATSTAASIFDLLPSARTTYAWSVQLTAGTWADIFSSTTVLSVGTWMVQVFVNDFAVGGQQYSETYSGIMSWGSPTSTNNGGISGTSEVILHRSGHAAQAGNFYLRTVERVASTLVLQGMSNMTYTAASTINFKFVKVF
jgi:hypothetical protein